MIIITTVMMSFAFLLQISMEPPLCQALLWMLRKRDVSY